MRSSLIILKALVPNSSYFDSSGLSGVCKLFGFWGVSFGIWGDSFGLPPTLDNNLIYFDLYFIYGGVYLWLLEYKIIKMNTIILY